MMKMMIMTQILPLYCKEYRHFSDNKRPLPKSDQRVRLTDAMRTHPNSHRRVGSTVSCYCRFDIE